MADDMLDDPTAHSDATLNVPPDYQVRDGCLGYYYEYKGKTYFQVIGNFVARIVEERRVSDGLKTETFIVLEGRLSDGTTLPRIEFPAAEFGALNWMPIHWGVGPVLYPGNNSRDHARAGIQFVSRGFRQIDAYVHLGWRLIGNEYLFLHAGGAIGKDGLRRDVCVEAEQGQLQDFHLPSPPIGDDLIRAVRASLAVLTASRSDITYPSFAANYRAPLAEAIPIDLAIFLVGSTGVFKSAYAALLQSHWGLRFSGRNLPESWTSTVNALEMKAYLASGVLFTVDDYVVVNGINDFGSLQGKADRLIRNSANGAGRSRMSSTGSLRPTYPPRCLLLVTGEDIPHGQSLRARLLAINIGPSDIDKGRLTDLQGLATQGLFVRAMSGYIKWLAPQMTELKETLPRRQLELRQRFQSSDAHHRTPDIAASLAIGLETVLRFALEVGAISEDERSHHMSSGLGALEAASSAQAELHFSENPATRFLELLRTAFTMQMAHLEDAAGGEVPRGDSQQWGWSKGYNGSLSPKGTRIGWVKSVPEITEIWLQPDAAFAIAQRVASMQHTSLSVSLDGLVKRLREAGHLIAEGDRHMPKRKTPDGRRDRMIVRKRPIGFLAPRPCLVIS